MNPINTVFGRCCFHPSSCCKFLRFPC
jgi:hypothetical protein